MHHIIATIETDARVTIMRAHTVRSRIPGSGNRSVFIVFVRDDVFFLRDRTDEYLHKGRV